VTVSTERSNIFWSGVSVWWTTTPSSQTAQQVPYVYTRDVLKEPLRDILIKAGLNEGALWQVLDAGKVSPSILGELDSQRTQGRTRKVLFTMRTEHIPGGVQRELLTSVGVPDKELLIARSFHVRLEPSAMTVLSNLGWVISITKC